MVGLHFIWGSHIVSEQIRVSVHNSDSNRDVILRLLLLPVHEGQSGQNAAHNAQLADYKLYLELVDRPAHQTDANRQKDQLN